MARFQKLRVGILEHIDDGRLSGIDLAVFTFLLLRCKVSGDRGVVWTHVGIVADTLGLSEKQVRSSFKRLETHSYLRCFREQGSRGRYPVLIHRYELTDQGRREVYIDAWKTTDYRSPITYQGSDADSDGGSERDSDRGSDGGSDRGSERGTPYSEILDRREEEKKRAKPETDPEPGAIAPAPPVVVPSISTDAPDPIPYAAVVEAYNAEIANGTRWSRCVRLTDQLRKTIRGRWHDAGATLDGIRDVFRIVRASDFLISIKSGSTDISWVLGPKNFSDLLNGKYAPSLNRPAGRLATRDPDDAELEAQLADAPPEVRAQVLADHRRRRAAHVEVLSDSEGIPFA